jgi:hypothetical protein
VCSQMELGGGGSKSKPFVWSILKSTSKSRQDEMCYNFDVAMCKWHNHVIPSLKQLKNMLIVNDIILILMILTIAMSFVGKFNQTINEGRLNFTKSPQMKLDKEPFPVNMNMVELDGKKVLVRPSQAESTKGKNVVIGEERPPRMIKPKSLKDGQ